MIFQDRELLRRRREESHQTVDDDRFYSKAALTLCFSYTSQDVVPSLLREGCGIPFVQTRSRKDEQADGRDSRQLPWAARIPKAWGSSKQKGVPRSPRPGPRGAGVWNRDYGFCTRQLWTPDARRARLGDTAEGLSSEHSRAGSRPAPPAEAVRHQG